MADDFLKTLKGSKKDNIDFLNRACHKAVEIEYDFCVRVNEKIRSYNHDIYRVFINTFEVDKSEWHLVPDRACDMGMVKPFYSVEPILDASCFFVLGMVEEARSDLLKELELLMIDTDLGGRNPKSFEESFLAHQPKIEEFKKDVAILKEFFDQMLDKAKSRPANTAKYPLLIDVVLMASDNMSRASSFWNKIDFLCKTYKINFKFIIDKVLKDVE